MRKQDILNSLEPLMPDIEAWGTINESEINDFNQLICKNECNNSRQELIDYLNIIPKKIDTINNTIQYNYYYELESNILDLWDFYKQSVKSTNDYNVFFKKSSKKYR